MSNTRPNPYPGPRAFQHGEALYGRERETAQLLDLLIAERVVLLYAPSGAGKTSLVQAALVPELAREGYRVFPSMRVSLQPGAGGRVGEIAVANRYVLSLLLSLEEALPPERRLAMPDLARISLDDYLARETAPAGDGWHGDALIFDQFEEILAVQPTDVAGKTQFFEQVGKALRDYNRWALFAMREEFVAGLDPYVRPIPARFDKGHRYRLDLLGLDAARAAMQGPARGLGVTFTAAAAARLAENLAAVRTQGPEGAVQTVAGTAVEPVQLQVVCRRLWEGLAPDDAEIGVDDVQDVGDVEMALRDYYAATVADVAAATGVRERAIRDWFDTQLITLQGIRGQVLQGPASSPAGRGGLDNRAVAALVDAHLVRAERRRDANWLELAHDRLVEPVQRDNADWRERHLSALQRQAALWESEGRPPGLLLGGQALEGAEAWAAEHGDELEAHEAAFLAECRAARAQAGRERRQAGRIRRLAVLAGVVAAIALAAAGLAFASNQEARRQARLATSRELAASAASALAVDPELGVLLAVEAGHAQQTAQAEDALRQALSESRVRAALLGHKRALYQAAFSPDGKRAVTASADGTARVWDAATGAELVALRGHEGDVNAATFSPDGRWIVTAGADATARVWDAATGREVHTLAGHTDAVRSAVFSPDGRLVATASLDGTARIWDAATGRGVAVLRGHGAGVRRAAFSPDSKWIVTASLDGTGGVWEAATGQRVATLEGHTGQLRSATFSPDGKSVITTSADKTARVWEAGTGRLIATLTGHLDWVYDAAFSPDGALAATSSGDGTVRVWDTSTWAVRSVLYGHTDRINSLRFSPDGRSIITAGDTTARVWDARQGQSVAVLRDHSAVADAEFSPDGTWAITAGADGAARIWDLSAERSIEELAAPGVRITGAVYSPDGSRAATASQDGTVRVWDVASGPAQGTTPGRTVALLQGHAGPVNGMAFSPDGKRLVTAGEDGTARVWGLPSAEFGPTAEALAELRGHDGPVMAAVFSPDGRRIATASLDKTARLWAAPGITATAEAMQALAPAAVFAGHTDRVSSVAFSGDGKWLLTASDDGTARLWPLAAGSASGSPAAVVALRGHTQGLRKAVFSPDNRWVATASFDGTARIWDTATGKMLAELRHTRDVYDVAFSPDGARVATASADHTAAIWDAATGKLLVELDGHTGGVTSVAFSPDGRWVVTAGQDGTTRAWDASTGRALLVLRTAAGEAPTAAFSPAGKYILTAGNDDAAHIYICRVCGSYQDLLKLVPAHVTRGLACGERRIYLHEDIPCPAEEGGNP